jgi:small subunit ribosomal protein S4
MAIDRTPVMKRARSLGIEAAFTGSGKKSKKKPPMTRKKPSDYGLQLKEKQKAKFIYGVLERQFRNYFEKANKMQGITGENLLRLLEFRLDNVVFRLGFGRTRKEARQIVGHKLILVNGKRVNIPSYQVKVGDVISIREKSTDLNLFRLVFDATANRVVPDWLSVEKDNYRGTVMAVPNRDQIDVPVAETFIVELYSK